MPDKQTRLTLEERRNRLKKMEWVHGNKMLIETGHVAFDAQTNTLGIGNIVANTMVGHYIRPWNDTTHWQPDLQHKPGYLQQWDLEPFRSMFKDAKRGAMRQFIYDPEREITEAIEHDAQDESVQLYCIFHYGTRGRVVHGFILTNDDNMLLRTWYTGPTHKSDRIIDEVVPYLSWKREDYE